MSSSPSMNVTYCFATSSLICSGVTEVRLRTNPPFEPSGTITAFLTFWAFISPRTSVRKSSLRSDQRIPPRDTMPARRWTASISVEYTQTSYRGMGFGISGTRSDRSLKLRNDRSGTYAFVRTIASIVPSRCRRMLSWSRERRLQVAVDLLPDLVDLFFRGGTYGIETGFEHPHEPFRDGDG